MCVCVCVRACVCTFQPENFTRLNLCVPKIGYNWLLHTIYLMVLHVCVYVCVCVHVCVCALFSPEILHAGAAKGLNDDHKSLSSFLYIFFMPNNTLVLTSKNSLRRGQ